MEFNCQSQTAGRCMCPIYVNIEKMILLSNLVGIDEPQLFCELPQTRTITRLLSTQKIDFSQDLKTAVGCDQTNKY